MKNYKDAFTIVLGVLFIGSSFILASEIQNNYKTEDFGAVVSFVDKINSDSIFREDSHDFGSISLRGEDKTYVFSINNNSENNIVISKIYTSSKSLDAFVKTGKEEIGPFNITDYLFPFYSNKTIKKGKDFFVKIVLRPSKLGPLGIGLTQPFAVIEDATGKKIILKTSALVFP